MTSKLLSPEEVHEVGVTAFENALRLMSDAAFLLEAGRPRRAYALGVIAVEETAKHLRCRDVLQSWVSGMAELFATLGIAWRGSLDDALAEAIGEQEV